MKQRKPIKPIPKWVQPVTDLHAKHTPIKPIPGWLVTSSHGRPLYVTLGRAPKSASGLWRTIRIEIREHQRRPGARQRRDHERQNDQVV